MIWLRLQFTMLQGFMADAEPGNDAIFCISFPISQEVNPRDFTGHEIRVGNSGDKPTRNDSAGTGSIRIICIHELFHARVVIAAIDQAV